LALGLPADDATDRYPVRPCWNSTGHRQSLRDRGRGVAAAPYEAIVAKAECHRDTVCEALKVLERAGVLTWQNRIARIRERCSDLFGPEGWRWRVRSDAIPFGRQASGRQTPTSSATRKP
jgi:hypothetical protein